MKKIALLLVTASLLLLPACQATGSVAPPIQPILRLSTTTSVNDAGLLPALETRFEKRTGYQLDIVANGTGAAIELGQSGDADVLLVHAKASEETFITEGYGVERIPFMYNFFVIAGPSDDPAAISQAKTAAEAFKLLSGAGATFISRGDDSGTHRAEQKIWDQSGLKPAGDWYVSAGSGMGACLTMAGEKQAYILTDKATFLATQEQTGLKILLGESDDLKNTYSMIAVNPAKNPGVNEAGADAFIDFMLSDEASKIIAGFGVEKYGEPLFFLS